MRNEATEPMAEGQTVYEDASISPNDENSSHLVNSLNLPSQGDHYAMLLKQGAAEFSQFERSGILLNRDDALATYRLALRLCPAGDSRRCEALGKTANVLSKHFEQHGSLQDLGEAIALYQEALTLQPERHPTRLPTLNNLAYCLFTRYMERGDVEDLEQAIKYNNEVLDLPWHPDGLMSMNNLAACLEIRYQRQGNDADLDQAIEYHQMLVLLRPVGHPHRLQTLNNLGNSLMTRYEQHGKMADLEQAINHHNAALSLWPTGNSGRSTSLINLANCYTCRYEKSGDDADLTRAMACQREALANQGPGHTYRPKTLHNLANSLRIQYMRSSKICDLNEAIGLLRDALTDRKPGHPDRSATVDLLGSCLMIRYQRFGDIVDLENVISSHREALALQPPGHHGRPITHNNLGSCLEARFDRQGLLQDLEEAIDNHRDALLLRPSGHPGRLASLNNLANCLMTRSEWVGDNADLEEAVVHLQTALQALPPTHPSREVTLANLALGLRLRHKLLGDVADIDSSIHHLESALDLQPVGHCNTMITKQSLALCLESRFHKTRDIKDLERAIEVIKNDEENSDLDHPAHATKMSSLAKIYMTLSQFTGDASKQDDANMLFRDAVDHRTASIRTRLRIAGEWLGHLLGTARLPVYQKCLELADRYVLLQPFIGSRHSLRYSVPRSLGLDAAACAIADGKVELAVEFLEQGRALLWSQMGRYRASLRGLDEGLASKFDELSRELEHITVSAPRIDTPQRSLDDGARNYREMAEAWQKTVESIRKSDPRFSNFLIPDSFTHLKQASANRTIIIVNISQDRSDAIIIRNNYDPVVVPLPATGPDDIDRIASNFSEALSIGVEKNRKSKVVTTLRLLWEQIVEPVVNELRNMGIAPQSRLWWCPTWRLTSLPLHAAGPYRPGEDNLPDLYISSYIPSLSALIKSSRNPTSDNPASVVSFSPKLLFVGHSESEGQNELKFIQEELCRIKDIVPSVDTLLGEEGNYDAVIAGLRTHQWVHFSSHGSQNLGEPFNSCFHLRNDEILTLLDIIQAHLDNAEFAFLSACHTANADKNIPDETIHLATGLQFCGFRSVIGTMYAMADEDGPIVAAKVYQHMFQKKRGVREANEELRVDFRDAAEALNIATKYLRDVKRVPIDRWINFVHIGA